MNYNMEKNPNPWPAESSADLDAEAGQATPFPLPWHVGAIYRFAKHHNADMESLLEGDLEQWYAFNKDPFVPSRPPASTWIPARVYESETVSNLLGNLGIEGQVPLVDNPYLGVSRLCRNKFRNEFTSGPVFDHVMKDIKRAYISHQLDNHGGLIKDFLPTDLTYQEILLMAASGCYNAHRDQSWSKFPPLKEFSTQQLQVQEPVCNDNDQTVGPDDWDHLSQAIDSMVHDYKIAAVVSSRTMVPNMQQSVAELLQLQQEYQAACASRSPLKQADKGRSSAQLSSSATSIGQVPHLLVSMAQPYGIGEPKRTTVPVAPSPHGVITHGPTFTMVSPPSYATLFQAPGPKCATLSDLAFDLVLERQTAIPEVTQADELWERQTAIPEVTQADELWEPRSTRIPDIPEDEADDSDTTNHVPCPVPPGCEAEPTTHPSRSKHSTLVSGRSYAKALRSVPPLAPPSTPSDLDQSRFSNSDSPTPPTSGRPRRSSSSPVVKPKSKMAQWRDDRKKAGRNSNRRQGTPGNSETDTRDVSPEPTTNSGRLHKREGGAWKNVSRTRKSNGRPSSGRGRRQK